MALLQLRSNHLLDDFLDVMIPFYSASTKKVLSLSPIILVASAASMLISTLLSTKVSTTLLLSTIIKSAQKLVLRSPKLSTKLPAYQINWLSYKDIRRKLFKYTKEEGTSGTIKEDLLSLLSKFLPSDIRFTLVATLSKLELDIEDLSVRKNKLI